jgi:predicted outer membrane repeat protein
MRGYRWKRKAKKTEVDWPEKAGQEKNRRPVLSVAARRFHPVRAVLNSNQSRGFGGAVRTACMSGKTHLQDFYSLN